QYAVAPIEPHMNSYDLPLIFQTEYEILDGEKELFPGISLIVTPGHSPGSQCVIVDTSSEKYMIVGDLMGLFECYENTPMLPSAFHTDLVTYYASLKRVKKMGLKILPCHDPKVFGHPSYPVATGRS
ncbi:MAG: MBL fold metallo-hydrolase, partial [Planctomycetota bacterium]|nr:MBL fold metallo-hydrolase [Planctomycetota bacterium]